MRPRLNLPNIPVDMKPSRTSFVLTCPSFSLWHWVVVLCLAVPSQSGAQMPCVSPPQGLVCWWRAEGDASDYVGLNPPYTVEHVAFAPGKVGEAWEFNGTTSRLFYNSWQQWPGLDVGTQGAFTFEGWFQANHTDTLQYLISSYKDFTWSPGIGTFVAIGPGGSLQGNVGAVVRTGTKTYVVSYLVETESGVIRPGAWTHFAFTYNHSTRVANLYVNGTLRASTVLPWIGYLGHDVRLITDAGFWIGGLGYNEMNLGLYSGRIDELSVYSRALTPDQIAAIYAAGESGKCSGPPAWGILPADTIALVGRTNLWFARAVGAEPLFYQWYRNGEPMAGATSTRLTVGPSLETHTNFYHVVVSNAHGIAISPPIRYETRWLWALETLLDVGAEYRPWRVITESNVTANVQFILLLESTMPGGQVFYTLNGRTPDHRALPYRYEPILIDRSCLFRAAVYSADLTQRWEMPPIRIEIIPRYAFQVFNAGGGQVTFDPQAYSYLAGSQVTIRAVPDPGWAFLHWAGDLAGWNPEVRVVMDRNWRIEPVFGTFLRTFIVGQGSLVADPALGPYPAGGTVRLTAIPAPGYGFSLWGGAVSGTSNPVTLTINTAEPPVVARFDPLEPDKVALTVIAEGNGRIEATPSASVLARNTTVTLRAVPGPGALFLGWAGDLAGSANPQSLIMNTSKVIHARFTASPVRIDPANATWSTNGFRLPILSPPGKPVLLETSTNLIHWTPWLELTNYLGQLPVLDGEAAQWPYRFYRVRQP